MTTSIKTAAGRGTLSAAARSLAKKPITTDALFTPAESALLYHAVTGVCPAGTAEHVATLALPGDTLLTIAEITKTANGQPGHEEFARFAASDVTAAAAAIQAAVDLIPGNYFGTLAEAAQGERVSASVWRLPNDGTDLHDIHRDNLEIYQDKGTGSIRDCTANDNLVVYIAANVELKVSGLRARHMRFESSTSRAFYAGRFAGGSQNHASELVDIKIATGNEVYLAASSPVFNVELITVSDFRLAPQNGGAGFTVNYSQGMAGPHPTIQTPSGSTVRLIGDVSKVDVKVPQKNDAPITINILRIDTGRLVIQ
jgi:hypothetical protein